MRDKKPPFEINHHVIDYVAEIADPVGKLEVKIISVQARLRAGPTTFVSFMVSLELATAVLISKRVLTLPWETA